MILSTLSFALMNALVKYLISYHTFQLVFFRSLGSLIITFSILKSKNIPLLGNQKTLLFAIYNNQNQRRYIGIKLD